MSAPSGSFLRDNAMLVHVGVEILLFGGVIIWTNKRLSDQEKIITELKTRVDQYEELLTKQGEMLKQHHEALEEILNNRYASVHQSQHRVPEHIRQPEGRPERPQVRQSEGPQSTNQPQRTVKQPPIKRPQQSQSKMEAQASQFERPSQSKRQSVPKVYEEEESRIQEIDESELDNEIADEINELGECDLETGECTTPVGSGKKKSTK